MKYVSSILNWCYPPLCLTCDSSVSTWGTLCSTCWKRLSFLSSPLCAQCGYPLPYDFGKDSLCGTCTIEAPPYDQALSLFYYKETGKSLIHRLKFSDQTYIARYLSRLLVQQHPLLWQHTDLILPVPMHRWRFLRRGFNQAALLVKAISKLTSISYHMTLLKRTKLTTPQSQLTFKQRQTNLQGSLHLSATHKGLLEGKRIILIDDVMTTGSTIRQCCKLLRKAHPDHICVVTLARTIK